jgi:DNA polymerase-3 subunit delta
MQLALNQLGAHLVKGLKPIYVLHGDEPLLQQEAADQIRKFAREQGFTERSVFTAMGAHFDWSAVLAAGGSLSLFADRQLLEVRIPSGKPGKEGSQALQELTEQTIDNDALLVLVLLPRLDKAATTSVWFTALEGRGVGLRIDPIERAALPAWIAQRLALQGQKVADGEAGQQTLQFFAERVEGNLLAAHQEIQKLSLLYPQGELSLEQVEACVMNVARYDVFKLGEAVLSGHQARVQRMLDGLRAEGESEVLVHFALAEDIRALRQIKESIGQGQPLPLALRENRVWGLRERLFERALPRLSQVDLDNLLLAAHKVDGLVKGLRHPEWPLDPWQALHQLAMQLCQACLPATAKGR